MSTACPEDVLVGREGNVACDTVRLARITNWTGTEQSDETTWHDSDSDTFRQRIPAVKEFNGSFDFKFDTNFPQYDRVRAGECCILVLYHSAELYWHIPSALISSLSFTVNIEDLEVEEGSCDFASNGSYSSPSEAAGLAPLPGAPS